jgi:hypothetical protein
MRGELPINIQIRIVIPNTSFCWLVVKIIAFIKKLSGFTAYQITMSKASRDVQLFFIGSGKHNGKVLAKGGRFISQVYDYI